MRAPTLALTIGILASGWPIQEAEAAGPRPDFGVIKNQASPYAKLHSVDLASVTWTKGFWADRFAQTVDVTLPRLLELAEDPQMGHVVQNLKIAAGLAKGEFRGTHWQDAWAYKWIESACYVYAATRDEKLLRKMDEIIATIARAQQPDGYIASQITARGWPRFQKMQHHELYVMGHLMTAASIHHRITGKTSLLDVAERAASYVLETFRTRKAELADFPINPSIIMGGVELYRTTGRRKYLEMSNLFIDLRGSRYDKAPRNPWAPRINGSDLNQNWRPLRKETEVVGHAVFFTYLFAGATDAYMETGDETLMAALERLWEDLTERKMYITGGISPMHKAHPVRSFRPGTLSVIAGDSIHEGVGGPFELPNDTAYNETCGQIGNLMWNWRMLAVTGEPRFADIMERSLYNSILSGIGLAGKLWSYTNPLHWNGPDHVLRSQDSHERFDPGIRHICCPTNLLRIVASWNGYLYSGGEGGLWVHHYGGSVFDGELPGVGRLTVTQETDYPWEGQVALTIDGTASTQAFPIALRIPEWAKEATLKVNGKDAGVACKPLTYAKILREWRKGDKIELDLPMPVRMVVADPRVEFTRNQVAVMRGPVVYCMESTDLPKGVRFEDIRLPRDAKWEVRRDPKLLGGVPVLEADTVARSGHTGSPPLYQELKPARPRKLRLRLIPYYAWNNRGEPKMTVWLPLD